MLALNGADSAPLLVPNLKKQLPNKCLRAFLKNFF